MTQLVAVLLFWQPTTSVAQSATWATALAAAQSTGSSYGGGSATAVNAAGEVFITGYFNGQLSFGGTTLTSTGGGDVFVAKWNPATSAWVWAVAGGGTGNDGGSGVVVSGTSVYVTGRFTNTSTNTNNVRFGGVPLSGSGNTSNLDVFVLKYTDTGSSATYNWAVAAGGTDGDSGYDIAVNGTSVYVTGYMLNTNTNTTNVRFGGVALNGSGTTPNGEVFVAKYTDAGNNATYNWAVAAGGSADDTGNALAVSGTSVYVTGSVSTTSTNTTNVRFGSVAVSGSGSQANRDVFVAKYTDTGSSASAIWAVTGGGPNSDQGGGIAVSGPNVYVTGQMYNTNDVRFGGVLLNGATIFNSLDVFVLKYTDAGNSATYGWATVGGGRGADIGYDIAASGPSVYVTGQITSNSTNTFDVRFGGAPLSGSGTTVNNEVFVAKYTDAGSAPGYNWAITGGGPGLDEANGLAVSGTNVYVTGASVLPAGFGATTFTGAFSGITVFGALIAQGGITAVQPAASLGSVLTLLPNPTAGPAVLRGAAPRATVQVVDALGRVQLTTTADAAGMARLALPVALPAGVYLVRSGRQVTRLVQQ